MADLNKFADAVDKSVRPSTDPVGIKLLKSAADIPAGIKSPAQALGHKVALCQATAFARFWGTSLASLKEDMTCPVGVMVLGISPPPDYWLDGTFHQGVYTASKEAAGRIARSMCRFKPGQYVGLVTAPLRACNFGIDMVWLHVNSAQLLRLIVGSLHKDGERFSVSVLPTAVCADALVPPMETGRCQMSVPCLGARRYARVSDDELIFTVPVSRIDEMTEGLLATQGTILGYPIKQWLEVAPTHPGKYAQLQKDLEMV